MAHWYSTDGRLDMDRWKIIALLFLSTIVVAAQVRPRDYSISSSVLSYDADALTAIIAFTVENKGGEAQEASEIIATVYQGQGAEARADLPALGAGQTQDFEILFPLEGLPLNEITTVEVRVGIDQYELDGSPIARNNRQLVYINPEEADIRTGVDPSAPSYDLYLPLVNLGIDFRADGVDINGRRYGSGELLGIAGILLAALFCLWLLSLALRLVFRRSPKFEPWQPPYAAGAWHDPNSALGRRQSWQFHAQNCTIDAPRVPNQVTVIKRLTDDAGVNLGGWEIKAVRTTQYDIYGRISRTEVVMPRKINKQLTRIARRARRLDQAELRKAILPVAKRLCRHALAAIEKQNRMLPLALDMRFEGEQGEARVHFELYQYRSDAWHLVDEWAPEMGKLGARVPEQFTFSLNGQLPGESYREYKARLRDDVTQLLAGLFSEHDLDSAPAADDDGQAQLQPETAEGEAGWPYAGPDDETDAR